MEDRSYVSTQYASGSYHSEGKVCKEDDDYWIFWSERRFLRYFVDGVKEFDPIEADDDNDD